MIAENFKAGILTIEKAIEKTCNQAGHATDWLDIVETTELNLIDLQTVTLTYRTDDYITVATATIDKNELTCNKVTLKHIRK